MSYSEFTAGQKRHGVGKWARKLQHFLAGIYYVEGGVDREGQIIEEVTPMYET